MYVSMKEMLQHASVNNYAVPAPNCPSYALVKAACMAAAEKKSAVIAQRPRGPEPRPRRRVRGHLPLHQGRLLLRHVRRLRAAL